MNGARRRCSSTWLLSGTKDEKIRANVEEFFDERQTSDSRRKKALAVLKNKKKMEEGVKE
jgi:hypothetical protein